MKRLLRHRHGSRRLGAWLIVWRFLAGLGVLGSDTAIGDTGPDEDSTPLRVTIFSHHKETGITAPALVGLQSWVTRFQYGQPLPFDILTPDPSNLPSALLAPTSASSSLEEKWSRQPPRPPPVYDVERWSEDHGLPETKVREILQTRDGYLWIGTAAGLVRFDGVRFVSVDLPNGWAPGVNEPSVRCLFEDEAGRLWVGTGEGLFCGTDGKFAAAPLSTDRAAIKVNELARRTAGGFWIERVPMGDDPWICWVW